jgi:hypothetical protein
MLTDEEIGELMKRATAELCPPAAPIISQAERRGRRLRRRRLAWIAGGNVAAVVAIAAVVAAVSLPAGLRPSGSQAGAGSAARASDAGPAASHTRKGHEGGTHQKAGKKPRPAVTTKPRRPMTTSQMLSVLRSLLPAGSVFTDPRKAWPSATDGTLDVNYNDGRGQVDIIVDVTPFTQVTTGNQLSGPGTVLALTCPHPLWKDEGARPAGALPISCQVRHLPGGGIERDAVMYADSYGFYGFGLYDQRTDGVEVFIQVANGYFDPYLPHVDRARPPGTMKLWEQVVESPLWRA